MADERLLGSYLVRVSLREHERHLAVHSVLTGERVSCADFTELAAYLDSTTARVARSVAAGGDDQQLEDVPAPSGGDGPDPGRHG